MALTPVGSGPVSTTFRTPAASTAAAPATAQTKGFDTKDTFDSASSSATAGDSKKSKAEQEKDLVNQQFTDRLLKYFEKLLKETRDKREKDW